jgi:uncharacterized protein (TIGR02444 family)
MRSRFWAFSLLVYDNAAVQTECLDLQDHHGIDVNLLLFCAYVGAVHSAMLSDTEVRHATGLVQEWHHNVVRSLRAARRALKPFAREPSSIDSLAAILRASVKTAEIEAERIEQTLLEDWSALRIDAWPRTRSSEAVAVNVQTLLAICNPSSQLSDLPKHLIAAALAAALQI